MTGRIDGKVAIVTGGASGIGRGITERFVAEGARVVLADINLPAAEELAKSLGHTCAAVQTDVLEETSLEDMVAAAVERFGRLDIAVNCAFGLRPVPRDPAARQPAAPEPGTPAFCAQDATFWRAMVDGALSAQFMCIKHEARQMAKGHGGAIVNIVSINSRQPGEGMSSYCSAKAGLEMLIRCAAMELGPYGIRVTGIGPGLVQTPATANVFGARPIYDSYIRNIPMGRAGQPSDIGAAALFLASDEGSWVSGDTLFVDGAELTREYPRMHELRRTGQPG